MQHSLKKIKAFASIAILLCSLQGTAQLKLDSISVVTAQFKPLDKTKLALARTAIANTQWQYVLPAAQVTNAATTMAFAKNRPTVAVLIHGVTGYPDTDDRTGTLEGARNYWGYDFVYDLFGATSDRPTTFTDDNPATGAMGRPDWETKFINKNIVSNHWVTIYGHPD